MQNDVRACKSELQYAFSPPLVEILCAADVPRSTAISSAKLGTRFLTLMDLSKETFFFRKDEVCEAISYCHSRTTKKEDLEKDLE